MLPEEAHRRRFGDGLSARMHGELLVDLLDLGSDRLRRDRRELCHLDEPGADREVPRGHPVAQVPPAVSRLRAPDAAGRAQIIPSLRDAVDPEARPTGPVSHAVVDRTTDARPVRLLVCRPFGRPLRVLFVAPLSQKLGVEQILGSTVLPLSMFPDPLLTTWSWVVLLFTLFTLPNTEIDVAKLS